ncbi:MAG: methenyltetrahydromethanopterin cyclohydrolase [Betaproteobacteria bacterium HGW-Betaproteobacteria-20]|nr:MAG: methenyltetrahydromethanopterin cyclohydrolase [Betaproteobacteria bacterium HGW-Betaproteobacteria-20]
MNTSQWPSVNALGQPLVDLLIANASAIKVGVSQHATGATIVDAGIVAQGSLEAGVLIAKICMGGLGQVSLSESTQFKHSPVMIAVQTEYPVLACLASQYAGWALSHEKFFSLGSGPARAIAKREDLFKELSYQDSAQKTVLVLETDKIPPAEIIEKVARDTNIKTANLTFILTPTKSLAGATQIVARVLEVALHKLHTLHFPLEAVVSGSGSAPLPPNSPDFLTAMGRTNDAILFGGFVQLHVKCTDAEAEKLARELPSNASKDYGKPFADVFKAVNMDFYQIDPLLFSPAKVNITNLTTGNSFVGGELNESLLNQSFGY